VNVEDQEYFKRIEDFIEQDVPKMEVPATLGEAPAYEPKSKQKGGRKQRSGNKEKKDGGNHGKNNRKRGSKPTNGKKPQEARPVDNSEKPKVAASHETAPKQQEGKPKRRHNHRHKRRNNAKNSEGTTPATNNG
jgi:hypothetical protein